MKESSYELSCIIHVKLRERRCAESLNISAFSANVIDNSNSIFWLLRFIISMFGMLLQVVS